MIAWVWLSFYPVLLLMSFDKFHGIWYWNWADKHMEYLTSCCFVFFVSFNNVSKLQLWILSLKTSLLFAVTVHVVVGTPGRILDLMNKELLKTDSCKMLVLDEVCYWSVHLSLVNDHSADNNNVVDNVELLYLSSAGVVYLCLLIVLIRIRWFLLSSLPVCQPATNSCNINMFVFL